MPSCVLVSGLDNWQLKEVNLQTDGSDKPISISLSAGHLAVGLASGSLQLYFRTKSEHLSLLWTKDIFAGSRVSQVAISEEEQYIGVGWESEVGVSDGNAGGVAVLEVLTGEIRIRSRLREAVTALSWSDSSSLYIGGSEGAVSLLKIDPASPTVSPPVQILALDSQVVQLASADPLLVGSTLRGAVICNNREKTYREVGSKPRHGEQGVALLGERVWSARPGCRLWEVEIATGTVLATRQYRKALSDIHPSTVVRPGGSGEREGRAWSGGEHGFSLLYPGKDVIVTYNQCGRVYLLDLSTCGVVCWAQLAGPVCRLSVCGSVLAVLEATTGHVYSIRFGELPELMGVAYHSLQLFDLCADLLLNCRKQIRYLSQESLDEIVALNQLPRKVRDFNKARKVVKLLEGVERLRQCRQEAGSAAAAAAATGRRSQSAAGGGKRDQSLPVSGRQLELASGGANWLDTGSSRSYSQDRNIDRHHSSTELLLKDSTSTLPEKSQSQEDLLDGGGGGGIRRKRKQNSQLMERKLSGSRRNMSASEQGLQALQLYNIKLGRKSSVGGSRGDSNLSSLESINIRGRRQSGSSNASSEVLDQFTDELRERLNKEARDAGIILQLEKIGRINSSDYDSNIDPESAAKSEAGAGEDEDSANLAELEAWLREEEAGRPGHGPPQDPPTTTEMREQAYSQRELGLPEYGMTGTAEDGVQGSDLFGDVLVKGLDRLVERGGDFLERNSLLGDMVERFNEGTFSPRINKELRLHAKKAQLEKVGQLSSGIVTEGQDNRIQYIKGLSSTIVELASHSNFSDEDDTISLELGRFLNESEASSLRSALVIILASTRYQGLFFQPLQEGLNLGSCDSMDSLYPKLVLMFEQSDVDFDLFIARALGLFSDILVCDSLESLTTSLLPNMYYTHLSLLALEEKRQPHLAPIRLEQIVEDNVRDCSNFLSSYQDLSLLDLLRYLAHILPLSSDSASLIIHSQVLRLPPASVLFTFFTYHQFLQTVITKEGDCSLSEAADSEWRMFLCKTLAGHLPGWRKEWRGVLSSCPHLADCVATSLTQFNQQLLNRAPSIAGAHKKPESLQLAPLVNFLLEFQGLITPQQQLQWCKQNTYMPGLVRCVLMNKSLAVDELPLIVELGDSELLLDVDLLHGKSADILITHIINVYKKGECPLCWDDLATYILRGQGPHSTFALLKRLSPLMSPGDISKRFYAQLIMEALNT